MSVAGEAQQVDDLEEMGWHHGNAEMEQAVAKADRAFQAVEGIFRDHIGLSRWHVMIGLVRGQRLLLGGRPLMAGLLQLIDVTVALVVHFPSLAEDPASFNVS